MKSPQEAKGLRTLADRYEGVLCDIWGVVHNGVRAHPGAPEALVHYREGGGRVVLITNAARPAPVIVKMLDGMNISRQAYDDVVSSGDVTRELVMPYQGQVIHHVGPATDLPMFEGIDVGFGDVAAAAAVVVTGLDDPSQTPADYEGRLALWLQRDLVLICANPDKVVEVGDKLVYCPGSLADIYEAMGGRVEQAGKPFWPIYDVGLQKLERAAGRPMDQRKILAVGDSVRTDATGASAAGLDFLFVTGSIHAEEFDTSDATTAATVDSLIKETGAHLAGFMPRLVW